MFLRAALTHLRTLAVPGYDTSSGADINYKDYAHNHEATDQRCIFLVQISDTHVEGELKVVFHINVGIGGGGALSSSDFLQIVYLVSLYLYNYRINFSVSMYRLSLIFPSSFAV